MTKNSDRQAHDAFERQAEQARQCTAWQHEDEQRDDLSAARGIMIGLVLGVAGWAIAWALWPW